MFATVVSKRHSRPGCCDTGNLSTYCWCLQSAFWNSTCALPWAGAMACSRNTIHGGEQRDYLQELARVCPFNWREDALAAHSSVGIGLLRPEHFPDAFQTRKWSRRWRAPAGCQQFAASATALSAIILSKHSRFAKSACHSDSVVPLLGLWTGIKLFSQISWMHNPKFAGTK